MKAKEWGGGRAAKIRQQLQEVIDRGEAICSKCGKAVHSGTPWDVDHLVNRDQAPWLTWERSNCAIAHRPCNRRAGAVYGNRKRGREPRAIVIVPRPSREW